MDVNQAIYNEACALRTIAVDAVANRCVQLAGEKAQLEEMLAERDTTIETLRKEVEDLKQPKQPKVKR